MGWDKPAIWVSDIGPAGSAWRSQPACSPMPTSLTCAPPTSGCVLGGGTGTQSVSATGGPKENVPVMAAAWWSGDGRTWTRAAVQRQGGLGLTLGTVFVGSRGLVAVGSASGGNESVAWTSADGRTWQPIAPGYFGAPPASLGVPTLPSCTITDDGTHIVAVGVADQLAVRMWTSSDGVAWQPLPSPARRTWFPPGRTRLSRPSIGPSLCRTGSSSSATPARRCRFPYGM